MVEKPPWFWILALEPALRLAVQADALLAAVIALMDDPRSGKPRPSLKWISNALVARGERASPQTIRRRLKHTVDMTFREFVTAALDARVPAELAAPGAFVRGVREAIGYRSPRGFRRFVVLHLGGPPRSLLKAS